MCIRDRVVEAPQLRTLVARIPLPELVAQAHDALLGACLLLVAASTPEDRVEAAVDDGVQQRDGLQRVTRPVRTLQEASVVDVVLDARHDQPQPELGDDGVAVGQHLGEVVAGVDVQHRERDLSLIHI